MNAVPNGAAVPIKIPLCEFCGNSRDSAGTNRPISAVMRWARRCINFRSHLRFGFHLLFGCSAALCDLPAALDTTQLFRPFNPNASDGNYYGLPSINETIDPGNYIDCRWGNRMSSSSSGTHILTFTPLTAPPLDSNNKDLFLYSRSSSVLSFRTIPSLATWSLPGTFLLDGRNGRLELYPGLSVTGETNVLYRKLHFSSQLYDSTNGDSAPRLDPGTTKLIVLVHGWNPESGPDSYTGEFATLVSSLRAQIAGTEWKLVLYHWEADADTGPVWLWETKYLPDPSAVVSGAQAAEIAYQHGRHLGELLHVAVPKLERVHFIAHSAGSWAARGAMKYLLQMTPDAQPKLKTQLTLLDPFIPGTVPDSSSNLSNLNVQRMAEIPLFAGDQKVFRLENYYSEDVTPGTDVADFGWGNIGVNKQVDWEPLGGALIGLRYYNDSATLGTQGHFGPIQFYADTVDSALEVPPPLPPGLDCAPYVSNLRQLGWWRSMFLNEPILDVLPLSITNAAQGQPVSFTAHATTRREISGYPADPDLFITYLWEKFNDATEQWDTAFGSNGTGNYTRSTAIVTDQGRYRVRATSAAGKSVSEFTLSFSDAAGSPYVAIALPASDATLSGSMTVTATTSQNVDRVEFLLDGVLQSSDTTAPFAWTWNTTITSNGRHTLLTKAYAGLLGNLLGISAPVSVTVNNVSPPPSSDGNDSSLTATLLTTGQTATGYLSTSTDVDWFKVEVTTPGTLTFNLTVPADKDYDLELFGPDATYIKGSYSDTGVAESINYNAPTAGTYYVQVYGYPVGNGSFSETAPYSLTVNVPPSAGSIYVTGYNSPYVVGFGTDGTPLGQIASTGISPGNTNLAFDSAGQLYVSINADWTIQKFSKTGASLGVFLTRTDGIQAPWDLAFGPTGDLYVVNAGRGAVSRYSVSGASLGDVISGLDSPVGLTFSSSGDIYVLFDRAGLVRRFSATGSDLGTVLSGLNNPTGLAFDAQGRMFIPQNINGGTVEVYSPSGIHVQTISSSDFNSPRDVVFDDLGRLYVANGIGGKIIRFSADLTPLGVFADSGGSSAINFVAAAPPIFTTQPVSQTVNAGQTASFTAAASGNPTPTLQWQVSANSGSSWSDLANNTLYSGVTTGTLSITGVTAGMNGYQYRCLASNAVQNGVASSAATLTVQATFASFQGQYFTTAELADTTISGAGADPDHDGINNLQEYAFGLPLTQANLSGLPLAGTDSGCLTLTFIRRHDIADLTYTVEVSGDLQTWNFGASYTQEIAVTGLDAQRDQVTVRDTTTLATVARRFIRLRLNLTSGATTATPPLGAVNIAFTHGTRFTGMSLVNAAVCRDSIASHTATVLTLGDATLNLGTLLDASATYFLEITSGPAPDYVGDRLEVDVAATKASGNNTITIIPSSPRTTLAALPSASGLAGCTVVVRPHVTLGQLFGTKGNTVMQGATVVANADQVQLLNAQTQSFETYYLLRNASGSIVQWTKVGGGSTNQDKLPIAPGVGMVVLRNGSTPVTLTWLGEVRQNTFALPLVAGNNLVSQPFPIDQSPVQRVMTHSNGFTGSTVVGNADQIQVYTGGAIQTYYLLRNASGSIEQWAKVGGGSTNYNQVQIIPADGAIILRKVAADPLNVVPFPSNL
ncbi:MAG: Ig-like domain-containing protein [Opitutaceae bacterium]|jgi:hypothetical protein